MQCEVSIVVPVLDEAAGIGECLRRLRRDFPSCELVVVDGGSRDGTPALAAEFATVVSMSRGRGRQLNAGAAATSGDVLWFVHADCVVPPAALPAVREALRDPRVVGGGLTLAFDRRSPGLDWLAWSSNHRARRLGWIFGDQALFVRRSVFTALGGFPELPLMEDLEFSRRLRRAGRVVVLPERCTASARRLAAHGPWRMTVLMQVLKVRYLLGADPEALRARYERGTRRGRARRPGK